MLINEMKALKPGDLVRHKSSSDSMIVATKLGSRVTAFRVADLSNPREWDRVNTAGQVISA